MPKRNYSNTATPQVLSAAVDATATTLTVSSTTGYPAPPFLLGLERGTPNEEVALCTAMTATTFTVERGYDGTSPKAHDTGTLVEHTVAAIDYREAGIARLTTSERNALTGDDLWEGRTIYNLDTDRDETWNGTGWYQSVKTSGDIMSGHLGVYQVSEQSAHAVVGATTTLDMTTGNVQTVALTQNTTLAFSGAPAGRASSVSVILKQDATGGRVVTWPTGIRWPDGIAPVLGTGANAHNIVTFMTPDGGTTWYGFLAGRNLA